MSEDLHTCRYTRRRITAWDIVVGAVVVGLLAIVIGSLARAWTRSARGHQVVDPPMSMEELRRWWRTELRKSIRQGSPDIRVFGMTVGQVVGVAAGTCDGGGPGVAVWQASGTVVGSEIAEEALAEFLVQILTYPYSQSHSQTTSTAGAGPAGSR